MADLVVIVPSRGRPEAVADLYEAFKVTCVADTRLKVVVDDNDPTLPEYPNSAPTWACESRTMGEALNIGALSIAKHGYTDDPRYQDSTPPFAVGFMGDDHRPRTHGWDKAYLDALREMGTGIVYGNDLLQGENIPTQVAMTSDIVRALGYMAPPSLVHLYFDNFWKVLGNGADCLRYLPDVIVEHMHPTAGKAEWDEGYLRVNSSAMYEHDRDSFADWLRTSMVEDVAKVRALRGAR